MSNVVEPILSVTLYDTHTQRVAPGMDGCNLSWWTEGNGSCDCNRRAAFGEPDDTRMTTCYGCRRYLIIAVEPLEEGYTLLDFNPGYPVGVLQKYFDVTLTPKADVPVLAGRG